MSSSSALQDSTPTDTAQPLCLEFTRCCLCRAENADPVGVGQDFEYHCSPDTFLALRCRNCDVVFLNPRPAESELERIYPAHYHAFEFTSENFGFAHVARRKLEARRLLSYCAGLPENARILDVGCGDGFHLGLLREFGRPEWHLEGIDASARAVSAAEAAGLKVSQGTVEECALPPGSYDLILLIATIEHVSDPLAVLNAVGNLLRPGGRAVLITDNTATLDFRLFGASYWGGYHFPRHWYLFNRSSLKLLAQRAELEVKELTTVLSPVNWVYSIRNWLVDSGRPNWLVEQFSLKAAPALGVFTIIDAMFQLAGKGALLKMVVQKPL